MQDSPAAPGWTADSGAVVGGLLSCRAERQLADLPRLAGNSEMPGCGSAALFVLREGGGVRERRGDIQKRSTASMRYAV